MAETRHRVRQLGQATPPAQTTITDDLDGGRFEAPTPDVTFRGVVACNVDFSGLSCWRFGAAESRFVDCSFDRLGVRAGMLGVPPGSTYEGCSFTEADLRAIDVGWARFERCIFDRARIAGWFALCAEFVECSFAEARIVGSVFSAKPVECFGLFTFKRRRRNEFRGNDFRTAVLEDTAFRNGIDLDAQLLPDDPQFVRVDNARETIRAARQSIRNWEGDQRRAAEGVLNALEVDNADSVFAQRDLFDSADPAARDRFWSLLVQEH